MRKKIAELLNIDYEQIELEYKKVQDKVVEYFIVDGRGAELKLDGGLLLQLECGIEFYDCKFPEFIKIEVKTYKYHLGFDKCTFEKGVSFEKSIFESKVVFTDSIFGTNCKEEMQSIKASFKRCVFKKEVKFDKVIAHIPVYFNHAEFGHDGKDGKNETDLVENADFHESRFEDVACFYCAKFFEAPNFSQTIFNGSPNFVSSKINFTFGGLKGFIKRKAGKDEKEQTKGEGSESEGEEGPSSLLQRWQLWFCCKIFDGDEDSTQSKEKEKINRKEKTANDYRDSFRLVKNALIKENDILNASQYHKIELYCKEIELESKEQKSPSYRFVENRWLGDGVYRVVWLCVAWGFCIGIQGYGFLVIAFMVDGVGLRILCINNYFIFRWHVFICVLLEMDYWSASWCIDTFIAP